jgi:hypothetical protein
MIKDSAGKNPNNRKGQFQKGHKINIGRICKEETKEKLRLANLGSKNHSYGKKLSEEQKIKISKALKGKIPKNLRTIQNMAIGRKHTEKTKDKISKTRLGKAKGDKHPNWKGGITPLVLKIRNCEQYKTWRSRVFQRDNWTCQTCGKRGCTLESHHSPKSFSQIFKENDIKTFEDAINCLEFWDISKGVTLCKDCHNLTKNRWINKKNGS